MILRTLFVAVVITRRGVSEAATFPREEEDDKCKNNENCDPTNPEDAGPPNAAVVDDVDVTMHVLIVIVDGDVNVLLLVILRRAFL